MDLEGRLDAYVDAWNARDPQQRAELLNRALTDGCELVGPTGTFRGRPAIDDLIGSLQGRLGKATVVRVGEASGDGTSRFAWEIRSPDGAVLWSGEDEVEAGDDGRLRRIQVVL